MTSCLVLPLLTRHLTHSQSLPTVVTSCPVVPLPSDGAQASSLAAQLDTGTTLPPVVTSAPVSQPAESEPTLLTAENNALSLPIRLLCRDSCHGSRSSPPLLPSERTLHVIILVTLAEAILINFQFPCLAFR